MKDIVRRKALQFAPRSGRNFAAEGKLGDLWGPFERFAPGCSARSRLPTSDKLELSFSSLSLRVAAASAVSPLRMVTLHRRVNPLLRCPTQTTRGPALQMTVG